MTSQSGHNFSIVLNFTFVRVITSQSCWAQPGHDFSIVHIGYWNLHWILCGSWLLKHVELDMFASYDFSIVLIFTFWRVMTSQIIGHDIDTIALMLHFKLVVRTLWLADPLKPKKLQFLGGVLKKESILCVSAIFRNWLFYKHPPNLWQLDCTGYVHTCTVVHLLEIVYLDCSLWVTTSQ